MVKKSLNDTNETFVCPHCGQHHLKGSNFCTEHGIPVDNVRYKTILIPTMIILFLCIVCIMGGYKYWFQTTEYKINNNKVVNKSEIYLLKNENISVQVKIKPNDANIDGAAWRIDKGLWNQSSKKIQFIPIPSKKKLSVNFKEIVGWLPPEPFPINIENSNNQYFLTVSYSKIKNNLKVGASTHTKDIEKRTKDTDTKSNKATVRTKNKNDKNQFFYYVEESKNDFFYHVNETD